MESAAAAAARRTSRGLLVQVAAGRRSRPARVFRAKARWENFGQGPVECDKGEPCSLRSMGLGRSYVGEQSEYLQACPVGLSSSPLIRALLELLELFLETEPLETASVDLKISPEFGNG